MNARTLLGRIPRAQIAIFCPRLRGKCPRNGRRGLSRARRGGGDLVFALGALRRQFGHHLIALCVASIAPVLWGCTLGPDFTQPHPETPASFMGGTAPAAPAQTIRINASSCR